MGELCCTKHHTLLSFVSVFERTVLNILSLSTVLSKTSLSSQPSPQPLSRRPLKRQIFANFRRGKGVQRCHRTLTLTHSDSKARSQATPGLTLPGGHRIAARRPPSRWCTAGRASPRGTAPPPCRRPGTAQSPAGSPPRRPGRRSQRSRRRALG
jgi:hypothetical protein